MTKKCLVGLVNILCWVLMILVKTWLERASNFSIDASSGRVGYSVLVDWMFFLVCFMCTFVVSMYGGRFFVSCTVRLVHVAKWNFLMV